MIRLLVITNILLVAILTLGCNSKITIYTNPEIPINTVVNEEFIISYQFDPPGYYWKEHHNKDLLTLVKETYGPVQKGSNAVTFAGTQYFRYKPLKPGTTYVTLTRLRLNEPDIANQKVFKVNITPKESLNNPHEPRVLTDNEKARVVDIALNATEILTWIERGKNYSIGSIQWYALWPHEWQVFNYDGIKTNPGYQLVPKSANWYPGITITFEETGITHPTKFQVAVNLETEEVVWLYGPIEVNG